MKVFAKITPKAKKDKVEEIDSEHFKIHVREAPEKGKANAAVIEVLAEHLGINENRIRLISGATSRNKVFEIK